MRIGLYTVALHDRPLRDVLDLMREWGISDAEVAAGGFVPTPHCPVEELLASADRRDEYTSLFGDRGMRVSALNVNGNPLHPDPKVGLPHSRDVMRGIELAAALGVARVVVMPGAPGSEPGTRRTSWYVSPWETGLLDARDYQWDIGVRFWKDAAARAADANVRLCLEAHPHTLAFNPDTVIRLLDAVSSESLGVNLDPSHFFWQGIDPIRAIARFGDRVWSVAAKDTIIDAEGVALHGVLDDRYTRVESDPYPLGGGYSVARPPSDGPWRFAAAGRGHDTAWWADFISALHKVGFDDAIVIENEDWDLPALEAVPYAARTLAAAIELSRVDIKPANTA